MNKNVANFQTQLTVLKRRLNESRNSTSAPLKRARPEDLEPAGNARKQPRVNVSAASDSTTGFILLPDQASDPANGTSGSAQETANEIEALQKRMAEGSETLMALMQSSQEAKEKLLEEQDAVKRAQAMLNAFCAAERSKVCWTMSPGLRARRH